MSIDPSRAIGRFFRYRPHILVPLGALGIVALGALAPTALGLQATLRIPIERASSTESDSRSTGVAHPGLEWPVQLELVPDALIVSAEGRESVEYHAEFTLLREGTTGIAWAAEVVNDLGELIPSELPSGESRGAQGDILVTAPMRVELADGFYVLRVNVAVATEDGQVTTLDVSQAVEVDRGRWHEWMQHEWYERSRAGIAFKQEQVAAGDKEVQP